MEKIIEKQIMGIVPKYMNDKGNSTYVYTKKEIIKIEKSIKTVIKNMSKYYHFDLKESNNTYRELLCTKKNPPIPFTKKDIFILIKTRKPIGKHDGAYGYINLDAIDMIKYKKKEDLNPKIVLKNGEVIEALCTIQTLNKAIKNGEIVKKLVHKKSENILRESPAIYFDEDSPATKKDIALLFMEIYRLHSQ